MRPVSYPSGLASAESSHGSVFCPSLPLIPHPPLAAPQAVPYEVFRALNVDRNGCLDQAELAALFKRFMPAATPGELRFVLGHIYQMDPNADSRISFKVWFIAFCLLTCRLATRYLLKLVVS